MTSINWISRQHHTTSLNMESRREKEKRTTENTWRHDLGAHAKETGYTWRQLERSAQDRSARRNHVGGSCPRRGDEGFDWLIDWFIELNQSNYLAFCAFCVAFNCIFKIPMTPGRPRGTPTDASAMMVAHHLLRCAAVMTVIGLSTPWCCPSMMYVVVLCHNHLVPFPVV